MEEKSYEDLLEEAATLVGRQVEVEELAEDRWIVLWMSFERTPPPPGRDAKEALINFIDYVRPVLGQVRAIEAKLDEAGAPTPAPNAAPLEP